MAKEINYREEIQKSKTGFELLTLEEEALKNGVNLSERYSEEWIEALSLHFSNNILKVLTERIQILESMIKEHNHNKMGDAVLKIK